MLLFQDIKLEYVKLVPYPDNNETRTKFCAVQVIDGDLIDSHAICPDCFACYSQKDKSGNLTGITSLKRHLSSCKPHSTPKIESFGNLAK